VNDTVIVADTVRCFVNDYSKALTRVVDAASKTKLPVTRVHVTEPTLEDVFIKLTGKALRE
jgi:2-C-methyl-D-erythritol 4-phosphate cytidylyltransferase